MEHSKITIFNENEITTAECNKSALMAFTRKCEDRMQQIQCRNAYLIKRSKFVMSFGHNSRFPGGRADN